MDNLKNIFIDEATEHINTIVQTLLMLEKEPDNRDLIEKIFRSMHTLKGTGAMFGFEAISQFTHHLETVYDLIRNEKISLTKDIADLTLSSADHLRTLLGENTGDNDPDATHAALLEKIEKVSGTDKKADDSHSGTSTNLADFNAYATYYIYFNPSPNVFDNGTNPLFLIDELATLGQTLALPYFEELPDLNSIDPYRCYTHWEIILSTKEEVGSINDVFIFVEDLCKLEIHKLGDGNFLANRRFVKALGASAKEGKDIGVDQFRQLSKETEQSVAFKLKKALSNEAATGGKDYSISSIRVSSDKLDDLMNLVSELVTVQARLNLFSESEESTELTTIAENIQKLTRQLRDTAFEIVLVPIETLVTRFQRLVRDLSKELNKEVEFVAHGTETELDKTIIENLTDPLLHIIRNCIDHGIEPAHIREMNNKPATGNIVLNAYHSSTNVHIEITDDGEGIDAEKVRKKAVARGLISEDARLDEKQVYDLLFLPGFSTAESLTGVSGRGVGMDVVRQKINAIRGEIELTSQMGKGTKILLKIPITLSIIDGLLVKVNDTHYLIPLSAVNKIHAIYHHQIEEKFNQLIVLDGEQIPYFYLRSEFNAGTNTDTTEQVVVIQYENLKVGLVVDSIVGEYQAVLKPLGKYYKNQEIISAATILGDGTIALVIDANRAITYFSNQFKFQEA